MVSDLFDRIGGGRYELVGLSELPEGFEWLLYEETKDGNPLAAGRAGWVSVEIYQGSQCVAGIAVKSLDPDTVLDSARIMHEVLFGAEGSA